MKHALIAFLVLPAAAWAQEDAYSQLGLGHRVQITFRSGATITGQLVAVSRDPKEKIESVDYTKVSELTIDMSWEYTGLNGTMSIRKDQIKEIRKLQALDRATLERLQKEKAAMVKALEQANRDREAAEDARDKVALEAAKKAMKAEAIKGGLGEAEEIKQLDKLKLGFELLKKFPPPEWGPHRIAEIAAKAQRKQQPTPEESDFAKNIDAWVMANSYREAKKSMNEGPKGETPAPAPAPEKKP